MKVVKPLPSRSMGTKSQIKPTKNFEVSNKELAVKQ